MNDDVPVTRSVIEGLDGWLGRLAAGVLPARQVPLDSGIRWELQDESPAALMVAKAVRAISGIRAALLLADAGFVTESASLLRIVSDLALEIVAVAEGVLRGESAGAQEEFVETFFRPRARSLEEHLAQARESYVSREELMKSDLRLANEAGQDGEHVRNLRRFLNSGFDAYVHGAYETAMELYHGGRHEFMLHGHESAHHRCVHRVAIAGKLHEIVLACAFIAEVVGNSTLHAEILNTLQRLEESDEQSGAQCT